MTNNKYYTPTINEFRVGFEYEAEDFGIWSKEVYQGEELRTYMTDEIERKEIRVKYLDVDDIESFGFEHVGEHVFKIREVGKTIVYTLVLYSNDLLNLVCEDPHNKHNELKFFGRIKNKSALEVLLKQLNIIQ
jgi:hypothetical protein